MPGCRRSTASSRRWSNCVAGSRARGHAVHADRAVGVPALCLPRLPRDRTGLAARRGIVGDQLDALAPDAMHIATEGPIGGAARAHCLRRRLALHDRLPHPLPRDPGEGPAPAERWGYAWFRRFHAPAAAVMVPSTGMFGDPAQPRLRATCGAGRTVSTWRLFQPQPGADLGLPRPCACMSGASRTRRISRPSCGWTCRARRWSTASGRWPERLQREYPAVHWRGVVPRGELARIYSAADVFVFPGRSETFGLVMLEAMACGTPVAAFPVAGPNDVVGRSRGGVLDDDLREAALRPSRCRARGRSSRALALRLAPRLRRVRAGVGAGRRCHATVAKGS